MVQGGIMYTQTLKNNYKNTIMYKTLQDLPLEMRETNKPTLYPQSMLIDLIIKLDNRDYYVAHADQSLSIVDNIKNMIMILSDNRITFTK